MVSGSTWLTALSMSKGYRTTNGMLEQTFYESANLAVF